MIEEIDDILFDDIGLTVLQNIVSFHIEFGRSELADSILEDMVKYTSEKGIDAGDKFDRIRKAMHRKMYDFSLSYARQYFECGLKPLAKAWLDEAIKYYKLIGIDGSRVLMMERYYERIGDYVIIGE